MNRTHVALFYSPFVRPDDFAPRSDDLEEQRATRVLGYRLTRLDERLGKVDIVIVHIEDIVPVDPFLRKVPLRVPEVPRLAMDEVPKPKRLYERLYPLRLLPIPDDDDVLGALVLEDDGLERIT